MLQQLVRLRKQLGVEQIQQGKPTQTNMSRAKPAGLFLLTAIALITVVVLIRTFTMKVRTVAAKKCSSSDADYIPLTEKRLDNFRQALRFQTVARELHDYNREQLAQFGQFIVQGVRHTPILAFQHPSSKNEVENLSLIHI